MSAVRQLDVAQRERAVHLFYVEGHTLGETAAELGCSVYALSPWLYAPAFHPFTEREQLPMKYETALELAREHVRTQDGHPSAVVVFYPGPGGGRVFDWCAAPAPPDMAVRTTLTWEPEGPAAEGRGSVRETHHS